jgi:hypothetical protein
LRLSADAISSRTKSSGLSSLSRPSASAAVSQSRPMTATSASTEATDVSMRSTKSTPGSIVSTSMKT